jgi:hypothetical protein
MVGDRHSLRQILISLIKVASAKENSLTIKACYDIEDEVLIFHIVKQANSSESLNDSSLLENLEDIRQRR